MKKFIVYLLVIVLTVSLGFAIFYFVRDNEIISISSASVYRDAGETFTLDVNHHNKKSYTSINVSSSDDSIVSGSYSSKDGQYKATAHKGGVARINVRTSNAKFRNLWCDVIVGDGTIESPFYITTAEQLAAIGMGKEIETTDENGNKIGTGVYEGAKGFEKYHSNLCYKVVNNINVNTVNNGYWIPLRNFNGRLDGSGHTISNIYIDAEGYQKEFGDKADAYFDVNCKAGFMDTIGMDGIVYNLKFDNYQATGTYSDFGTISAINYGTIERIEVKDAYLSIKTALFGGLVATNKSNQDYVVQVKEDNTEVQVTKTKIARIDRCSINMVLGEKKVYNEETGVENKTILGATGTIGGLVGNNDAGVVVYSYVRGDVYFAEETITYGGVVANNTARKGLRHGENTDLENEFLGANIKDCYSDLRVTLQSTPTADSVFAGAVAINQDYRNGKYNDKQDLNKVNSYLIGIYYNKDNLNYDQDGIVKNFAGIGKFYLDTDPQDVVAFTDSQTIVYGYTMEEMKVKDNFISHMTKEVQFDEDGVSKGVVEKNVLWLFDTVWVINENENDGLPYLNYQLVYIPDDFRTVGEPIVPETLDNYFYDVEVVYPVTILSGTDGKLRIKEYESYQLTYSPSGINLKWTTSDDEVVTVDDQGLIYGKQAGIAIVTATTNSGLYSNLTVIVEKIPYQIVGLPDTIYMFKGTTKDIPKLTIDPTPTGEDVNEQITYSLYDTVDNKTIATLNGNQIVANEEGEATLIAKFKDTEVSCKVVVTSQPSKTLTADGKSPLYVEGYYEDLVGKTNSIAISGNGSEALKCEVTSGSGVIKATMNGSTLNYEVKGDGTATVKVSIVESSSYTGVVYIYFTIKSNTIVTLTASPSKVEGYYNTMTKTGKVTITNSANTSLAYSATSSNSAVVKVVSMKGNILSYEIKGTGTAHITIDVSTTHYEGTLRVDFVIKAGQVVNPTYSIDIPSSITIYVGDDYTLTPTGNYKTPLTWTTSNSSVATVKDGKVTGVAVGNSIITVKSADGSSDTCKVYVKNKSTVSISVSPTSDHIYQGETLQLTATGNYVTVTWKSGNTNVATVDSNGLVTGSATNTGSATITATATDSNGYSKNATCTVYVDKRPVQITLTATDTTPSVGDDVIVSATTSDGSRVSWSHVFSKSNMATAYDYGNNQYMVESISAKGTITVIAKVGTVSESIILDVQSVFGQIWDAQDLFEVRNNMSYDNYQVMSSFSVSSYTNWQPIGTENDPFTGKIWGNGYTISDVNSEQSGVAGMFGYVQGAVFDRITINDSSIKSTSDYAGALFARGSASVTNCKVFATEVTAFIGAGGIAGRIEKGSQTHTARVLSSTITSTNPEGKGYVGGIVGYAKDAILYNDSVGDATKIRFSSGAHGDAGGIAGNSNNSSISKAMVYGDTSVGANYNATQDYAGGIVGYLQGANSGTHISQSVVKSVKISGYNAGGIAGSSNITAKISMDFKTTNKGYRSEDLSKAPGYKVNIREVAITTYVTITGEYIGGLFGILKGGVAEHCYARATLVAKESDSIRAGFAGRIEADGTFNKKGGSGVAGAIRYSYAGCYFDKNSRMVNKLYDFVTTSSPVHNSVDNRVSGYILDYLYYDTTGGKATFVCGNNIAADYVKASRSNDQMRKANTYTAKGFDSSIWNLQDGEFATLKNVR